MTQRLFFFSLPLLSPTPHHQGHSSNGIFSDVRQQHREKSLRQEARGNPAPSGWDRSDITEDLLEQRDSGRKQTSVVKGRQGLCSHAPCPPRQLWRVSVFGDFVFNSEVKKCRGSPPSSHGPWFPSILPYTNELAHLWSGLRICWTNEPHSCRDERLEEKKNRCCRK